MSFHVFIPDIKKFRESYKVMTNKSVYELELENLGRIINLENNDDGPLLFIISPDLPEWVCKIALCLQKLKWSVIFTK